MRKSCAVFLFSAATLLLEITFTRVLSVSHWHNFAFLVISTALLGFGVSGVLLAGLGGSLARRTGDIPAVFAALFAVSAPAALFAGDSIGFEEVLFSMEIGQLLLFLLFYLVYGVPFFFAGCAIGSVIWLEAGRIGKIYAANLCGSAVGCFLIFALLPPLGGVKLVFLCGLAGAASALLFAERGGLAIRAGAVMIVAFSLLLLRLLPAPLSLRVSQFKALSYYLALPDGKLLATSWNAISRTDVVASRYIRIPPAGLSLNFTGDIPPQIAITSDADSPSAVTRYCAGSRQQSPARGTPGVRAGRRTPAETGEALGFAGAVVQSLPYRLRPGGRALIVGAGGGLDCLTALANGVSRIEALEINPDVIDLVTNRFSSFSCNLFKRRGVTLTRAEGRNFLRHGSRSYNFIQIPLFDSVAASSAGVHGFSENYLYTVEAFRDCLRRLSPDGILCVTRWIKYPPRESLRMLAIGLAALEADGAREPRNNLVLVRSWSTTSLLVSRSPFSTSEIEEIKDFCDEMAFDPVYFPGITASEANTHNVLAGAPYFRLASQLVAGPAAFFRTYFFDVRPPTDNRPFFYHFLTLKALPRLWRTMGTEWVPFAEWGELVLLAALIQAGLVSTALAVLPLFLPARRRKRREAPRADGKRLLCYFFLLGISFIAIEITLMQKFVLFLGHPTYAMSVILFSLLFFAGVGSAMSERTGRRRTIALLCALMVAYAWGLPLLLDRLIGLPLEGRIAVTILLVAVPAVPMGTAFPLGIRVTRRRSPGLVPWVWAVNGSSSVFGAVATVFVAPYTGFNLVLVIAGALYALAALALPKETGSEHHRLPRGLPG